MQTLRQKLNRNGDAYHWTNHAIRKMMFYGLSPDRVKRIIRNPKRVEEGIAENTIGVMQEGTNKKKPTEIWVMYQLSKSNVRKIIISAWRYPGISPIREAVPIPREILEELKNEGII